METPVQKEVPYGIGNPVYWVESSNWPEQVVLGPGIIRDIDEDASVAIIEFDGKFREVHFSRLNLVKIGAKLFLEKLQQQANEIYAVIAENPRNTGHRSIL